MSDMYRTKNAKGVVAAGDSQSAQAGARILQEGGNAADAAVAAGLAAFVCEIALCGPLGGGVAVSQLGRMTLWLGISSRAYQVWVTNWMMGLSLARL